MKTLYEFVGGKYNGLMYTEQGILNLKWTGLSRDWTDERNAGLCVPRAELDKQPLVDGYLSPMYDGIRYKVDGELQSDWQLTDEEKQGREPITVIRYETQEVYDILSH